MIVFHYGTINWVKLGNDNGSELLAQWKGGWPARLAIRIPSQYVSEKSEFELSLKLATWIGIFSIYSREEITNFLLVMSEFRRVVCCTWSLDLMCLQAWWSLSIDKTLEGLQFLLDGRSGLIWSTHNSFPQARVYAYQGNGLLLQPRLPTILTFTPGR